MGTEIGPNEPNYFELYAQSVCRTTIVGDLLTFNRYGEYHAGRDQIEIPLGTKMVVHVPTLEAGYIRWEDQRPVESRMGLISDGFVPPKRQDLGDLDQSLWDTFEDGRSKDPWQFTNQAVMSSPDDNSLYTFTTGSKGGLGAIGELVKEYGKHIRQAPDEYPVVELQRRSYDHPEFGEVRNPVFKRVGWVDAAPYDALLNGGTAKQLTNDETAKIETAKIETAKTEPAKTEPPVKTETTKTALRGKPAVKL
jgi:hypothetical protein